MNVGCGQTPTQGWSNFDNSPSLLFVQIPFLPELLLKLKLLDAGQYQYIQFARKYAIRYADAVKRLPFATGSVDVLYSSHMLEHLDRIDAAKFMTEARRVLAPGGIFRLAVPDLEKMVSRYREQKDADVFIEAMLLTQDRPRSLSQKIKMLFVGPRNHQWMYDGLSLVKLLDAFGFVNARILKGGDTTIVNPGALDLTEREEESVYVEAVKP